jgi:hypothetical protein
MERSPELKVTLPYLVEEGIIEAPSPTLPEGKA